MGIKYYMEGFIKYLIINTVGNLKQGFTDHNASGRSLNECMTTRKGMFLSSFGLGLYA